MEALLTKNADGALARMSDNIRFLRLRQTVTKAELKMTLEGYFEKPGFGESPASDVLDMDSVFVQPSSSPVEGVTGEVYVLNVKAKVDMSSSIPFWSTYQEYFFVQEGEGWSIFAIL